MYICTIQRRKVLVKIKIINKSTNPPIRVFFFTSGGLCYCQISCKTSEEKTSTTEI